MIELAPFHKVGLNLANPVLLAAGCAGYGRNYRSLIDLAAFGALVTNPITLRPQRGTPQPRLLEVDGGLILNTGGQNPGVKKVIQQNHKIWHSLPLPVIAHLPAEAPDDLQRTARALAGTDSIDAFELGVPADASPLALKHWLGALQIDNMLPILVKLPLGVGLAVIEAAVAGNADALVLSTPPSGAARSPLTNDVVSGQMFSPALLPQVVYEVQRVAALVDLPLVAAGGVHRSSDVETSLAAGAVAVQIDTLLWVDPKGAEAVAKNFAERAKGG